MSRRLRIIVPGIPLHIKKNVVCPLLFLSRHFSLFLTVCLSCATQLGNFGDHKNLGGNLFELRFFFGPGFRIYYTVKDGKVIFLLCGGDKSTQSKDIKKARIIMDELE